MAQLVINNKKVCESDLQELEELEIIKRDGNKREVLIKNLDELKAS